MTSSYLLLSYVSLPLYKSFQNLFDHKQICTHYSHQEGNESTVEYLRILPLHKKKIQYNFLSIFSSFANTEEA